MAEETTKQKMLHPVAEADERSPFGRLTPDEFYAHHGVSHSSSSFVNTRGLHIFTQRWVPLPQLSPSPQSLSSTASPGSPAGSSSSPPAINYKVLVLKISIHCEGCKKKVTRILRKIQGVELISIDGRQNLVTLKADVDAQTLIQKLNKSGVRHAALFSEKNASEEKEIIKVPSESKEQKQEPQIVAENGSDSTKSSAVENQTEGVGKSAVKPEQSADEGKGDTGNSKPLISDAVIAIKKAPERGEEDTEKAVLKTSNESHQALPPYVVSYNVAAPSVSQSHYVQAMEATAHMYAQEQYGHPPPPGYYYGGYVDAAHSPSLMHHQAADPYNNMFSDENPNACAIM